MIVTRSGSLELKAYQAPKLKVYGSVQTLTTGGTGTMSEAGMMCKMGMLGNSVTRKHCV